MPNAAELCQQAETAVSTRDFATAVTRYEEAVAADPSYLPAHEGLLENAPHAGIKYDTHGKAEVDEGLKRETTARLHTLYEGLRAADRASALPLWGLANLSPDWEEKKQLLTQAVALDPDFTPAHEGIFEIEVRRCNQAGIDAAVAQLVRLQPDDPAVAMQAAWFIAEGPRSVEAFLSIAERFAGTETAASALHSAAGRVTDRAAKKELLERLVSAYPPPTSRWGQRGAGELIQLLIEEDPPLAIDRCELLAKEHPQDADTWTTIATTQQRLLDADAALAAGDPTQARELLADLTLDRGADTSRLDALQIRAASGSGDVDHTRTLAVTLLAKGATPTQLETIKAAVSAVGVTFDDVQTSLWEQLDAAATDPPTPLRLPDCRDGSTCDLADYRGRVVLVNFWYPGCAPCRNEFHYVQEIVDAVAGQPFDVLAVNGKADEDPFVLPFLDNNGYPFRPLRGNTETNEAWHVRGFPTAFLVDQRGKVVFRPHIYNTVTKDAALSQIRMLLDRRA